jgi:ATP-dependent DNA ligase
MINSAKLNIEENTGALSRFASVAEQVAATTKRTEKAAFLGNYFTSLSDDDLSHAARYFAGYIFPLRDQRTINIGGAALLTAITAVSGEEKSALQTRLVTLGDPGDVAEEAFNKNINIDAEKQSLTLSELSNKLEKLAATTGSKRKTELVTELLKRATPVEAKYIVKLLAGDLRIGLKEGAVEDAIARLFKTNVFKVQWANMLTGDIGETALLARHQRLDEARMRLFHPIKFMLASPAADLTEVAKQMPSGFAVEDKYDGIRAQIHLAPAEEDNSILHGNIHNGRRVALFSRTLDEITQSFPDLIDPLAGIISIEAVKGEESGLILDGEIVPVRDNEILPFQELQKRLGRKKVSEELLAAVPVGFIAYDVLYAQGQVLINQPFSQRRKILESLHFDTLTVRCAASKQVPDISQLDEEFAAARARGNEGLMVKDLDSSYKPGRRGRDWLKIKRALATLDVVVTAAEVGNGKRHRFLSDYTFAVRKSETDPTLLNIGKAYSGLTDAEITELSEWFRAHTLQELAHGKVCLVEPRIVLEVTFDLVQASTRHESGYALRFPRILRVRNDKPAEEIDTLETVRRLAETTPSEPATDKQEYFVDAAAKLNIPPTPLGGNSESGIFQLENDINQTPNIEAAHEAFKTFIDSSDRSKSIAILHDSDADGVTAGVVLQLALQRAGFEKVTRVIPDRDRNAWTPANRDRVSAVTPDRLFVLDLGSQSEPVINNVFTCFIDHHRPEGVPPNDTLISAYTWEPIPNTSLIVWELCQEIIDVSDLDWIAAIGTMSDLGEKAPFEMLAVAKTKYTAKYLKEASALINAARRASHYNPEVAAQALLTHKDPRSLVNSNNPEVEQLRLAKAEVNTALQEGKKAAPIFAGNVALVRVNSPCQIHPLIAQSWRTRLPKYVVIVANEGYIPGRINFSARTSSGVNVLDLLRGIELSEGEGSYGHGHDSASGGSLPRDRWNELLLKLGFNITEN